MAVIVAATAVFVLPVVAIPRVSVRFRLLREGEVTTGAKFLRLYRGWDSVSKLEMVFWAEAGSGEYTQTCQIALATLLAQGDWLACGVDDAAPRKTRAVYLSVSSSGTYTFNITSGEGAAAGDPARVQGIVRVEGGAANREIVLLERPADGEWRLAGYGQTPGGSNQVDARVVGGAVYAVSVDDYGVPFQPGLSVTVGLRIRPAVFAGVLYQVTEPGVLPVVEPEWWSITIETARAVGTAKAMAVRYFPPIGHGPITVELI